jgi:alpha-tubulin suppressor-like RCC1 family protein
MIRLAVVLACAGCLSKPDFPVVAEPPVLDGHLVAGSKHVCAIDATGALECWGDNHTGQLAASSPAQSGTPLVIDGTWTSVAAGAQLTCALEGGSVTCWGDKQAPAPVVLPMPATAIFAGGDGACATNAAGELYCWGTPDPTGAVLTAPTQVMPAGIAGPWQEVRLASDHACALLVSGEAYCWGHDDQSQLGAIGGDISLADAIPAAASQFLTLAVGPGASCGVTAQHALACWGAAYATNTSAHGFTVIDESPTWSGVAVGFAHVCGISNNGVRCYGSDDRGALGDDFAARATLTDAAVVDSADEVVAGDGFTCTRATDDSKQCWGTNEHGELGNGEIASVTDPIDVANTTSAVAVTAGAGHTCAILTDGTAMCWGDNRLGQVGGTNPFEPLAVVATPQRLDAITAGAHHTCGRESLAPAAISCWGDDSLHQRGGGTVAVPDTSVSWSSLSAGGDATCAVTAKGTLTCWGNVPTMQPTGPVAVAMGYSKVSVAPGIVIGVQTVVPTTNVVEWGDSTGDCSLAANSTALQPEVIDDAGSLSVQLAATAGHACRLEADTPTFLFCWGANDHDQCAQAGTCVAANTPDIVTPAVQWPLFDDMTAAQVATGGNRSCAITSAATSNELMCWGDNTGHYLAPLVTEELIETPQRAVDGVWATIALGPDHACGIDRTSSSVKCWGLNKLGEVGNGFRFHADPVSVVAP